MKATDAKDDVEANRTAQQNGAARANECQRSKGRDALALGKRLRVSNRASSVVIVRCACIFRIVHICGRCRRCRGTSGWTERDRSDSAWRERRRARQSLCMWRDCGRSHWLHRGCCTPVAVTRRSGTDADRRRVAEPTEASAFSRRSGRIRRTAACLRSTLRSLPVARHVQSVRFALVANRW